MPRSMRPSAISVTTSPTSAKVTSRHSPSTLCLTAVRLANVCAARGSRPPIVLLAVVGLVPASIFSSSSGESEITGGKQETRRSGFRPCLALGRRRLWCGGRVLEAGQEERLVDAALEDRDAELHALGDDFPPLEPRFARQLGRSEVNRHRCGPPVVEKLCTGGYAATRTSATEIQRGVRWDSERPGKRARRRIASPGGRPGGALRTSRWRSGRRPGSARRTRAPR